MDILRKFFRKNSLVLIVVVLSLIASHSLFHSGLIPTHDGEYHVIRFYEFDKTFRAGDLYPRWAVDLNNGFGVPLFNYVYPLPNYVALILHSINFSFIDSFKISLILASVIGSIFMYLWVREFWGELGGLVSSVFYTFSPYHFVDIYIRGSVGEVWALAFFPAFLWSITGFKKHESKKYFVLSTLFLSLIIFSHNILSLMFFVFALFYTVFIFLKSTKETLIALFFVFLISLGITSIFWAPAIFEKEYVRGLEIYDYSKNFPEFYQLIFPSWGSGFSSDPLQNQLSFQIGIANLIALFGSFFLILKKKKNNEILIFFVSASLIVFFMMLKISYPIWKLIPLFNYFQFPWRFLSLEILFTSFVAGSSVTHFKKRSPALFLMILAIVLGWGYSNIAYYLERPDSYYTTRSNFIDGTNSSGNTFNTRWMGNPRKEKEKIALLKGSGSIEPEKQSVSYYLFNINTPDSTVLKANIAYFPNWTANINNKFQKINITENGLFSFTVPKGIHKLEIKLEDTSLRVVSTLISVFSILALFVVSKFVRIIR